MPKLIFIHRLFILGFLLLSSAILQAQNPPNTGLAFWVRSDAGVVTNAGGLVTQWEDQSGNDLDAVQTDEARAPRLVLNAINSKPALRFDGADDFLDVAPADPINIVGDIASFAVIRVDDYANFNSIWGKTLANRPAPTDWYLVQGNGRPQLYRGDGPNIGNFLGTRPIRANNYAVIGFQHEGTSVTHYLNGQTNGTGQITAIPGDAGTALKIGSRDDLGTRMKGDIVELLIYNQALTETDVNAAINYLRNKYGILNSPPIVSITAPANNATFTAPANVTVTVSATDDDGTIARVDLFANGALVGTATSTPYSFPLTIETGGAVTLSAVATDDKDLTATSASRTITVTGPSTTPTLQTSPKLKLWLQGDAGVTLGTSGGVVSWADQSGNSNDALLVEPDEAFAPIPGTVNNLPSVHFDGTDDYLEVADSDSISITGDIASFFVARFDDLVNYNAIWGKTAGNLPRPTDYYLLPGSGVPIVYRGGEEGNQSVAGSPVTVNTSVLLGFEQQGTTMTQYQNGAATGTGQITVLSQDSEAPLRIGTRADLVTKMKGDIAELLIYDAALTSAEFSNLQQYLGVKYGITVVRSANTAPTLQVSGVTAGNTYTVPTDLTLTATTTDPDGAVSRVEFVANGTVLGIVTNAPYTAPLELRVSGPVTLTVTAIDNLGGRTVNTINFSATGSPTPPIATSGLVLWLKGDAGLQTSGSAVTRWEDQSGNFNHARQGDAAKQPAGVNGELGSSRVVRFDGTDDYLEVPSSQSLVITRDITSFFVVKIDDYAGFRTVWAKTSGNLPAPWDYWMATDDGRPNLLHNGGGAVGNLMADAPLPTDRYVIAGFDRADTAANHYLDQALNGTGTINGVGGDAGTPLLIGTRGDLFTKLKGALAELVIYNRALTEEERNTLQAYLQEKWFTAGPPEPTLSVTRGTGNTLVFSWPESETGFELQSTTQLGPSAQWNTVTEPVVPSGGQNTVTVAATDTARFFRLRKP